jgi:L-threonylcarbamoyladenylate synthase
VKTLFLNISHPNALQKATEILFGGGLVAFPTDTVYGLGALVNLPVGITRLYEAKARSANKAIAVLLGDMSQLSQITPELSLPAQRLAEHFWPGALTLVVPRHPQLPDNLSPLPTVGVRIPDHLFARSLMTITGPLATSSANISGENNTVTAQQVMEQLDGRIDLVLDGGPITSGVPSTVVDCTQNPPVILRQGAIPNEVIMAVINATG